jgi:hypothetical protein
MIVLSTARGNAPAVRKCCESVRAAGLRHRFAAADGVAFAEAVHGGCEIVLNSAAPQLENMRTLVATVEPHEIVIWLDGDDALLPGAVERIERAYRFGPWLTYGAFRYNGLPDYTLGKYFRTRYPGPESGARRFRDSAWRAAHLRTFRAGLFRRIPDAYFRRPDGSYFETCVDRAVMLPMLEMAGERYAVIEHEICDYNTDHFRAMTVEEIKAERADDDALRAMPPLEPVL